MSETDAESRVRKTLIELVGHYGSGLVTEPKRVKAFLADYCPGLTREPHALVVCVESCLARELLEPRLPPDVLVRQLTARLVSDYGIESGLASWAVRSWAAAFGIQEVTLPTPPRSRRRRQTLRE